jgi:excisionase family DNA binding protein
VSARRKGSDDADGPQFRVLYVRPVEAAAMMRISRSKFYEMMQRNQIRSCVIGGLRRVSISEIERFAAETIKAAD